jgi:hypothetical protein
MHENSPREKALAAFFIAGVPAIVVTVLLLIWIIVELVR